MTTREKVARLLGFLSDLAEGTEPFHLLKLGFVGYQKAGAPNQHTFGNKLETIAAVKDLQKFATSTVDAMVMDGVDAAVHYSKNGEAPEVLDEPGLTGEGAVPLAPCVFLTHFLKQLIVFKHTCVAGRSRGVE